MAAVEDLLATTRPATWSAEQWRMLLRAPADTPRAAEVSERNAT